MSDELLAKYIRPRKLWSDLQRMDNLHEPDWWMDGGEVDIFSSGSKIFAFSYLSTNCMQTGWVRCDRVVSIDRSTRLVTVEVGEQKVQKTLVRLRVQIGNEILDKRVMRCKQFLLGEILDRELKKLEMQFHQVEEQPPYIGRALFNRFLRDRRNVLKDASKYDSGILRRLGCDKELYALLRPVLRDIAVRPKICVLRVIKEAGIVGGSTTLLQSLLQESVAISSLALMKDLVDYFYRYVVQSVPADVQSATSVAIDWGKRIALLTMAFIAQRDALGEGGMLSPSSFVFKLVRKIKLMVKCQIELFLLSGSDRLKSESDLLAAACWEMHANIEKSIIPNS